MDAVYIGKNIPSEYHFAIFGDGYIDLYNTDRLQNGTFTYYRIYRNCDGFFYTTGERRYSLTSETTAQLIGVSDNWLYRSDIDKIFTVSFFFILLFIFVFNIVTSVFKKGGVFGGLL